MENTKEIPLHFELIPILGPPGSYSHDIRLGRFAMGRLTQRSTRLIGDLRETAIEKCARCRGGAFGLQTTGTLSGSTFQANPGRSSCHPIHGGCPIVRLEGVQLPACGVDYTNAPPGIKQNGDFRLIGIDSRGRHGRLEYPLCVFQEEIHNPLIERDRKNCGQSSHGTRRPLASCPLKCGLASEFRPVTTPRPAPYANIAEFTDATRPAPRLLVFCSGRSALMCPMGCSSRK